MPSGATYDPGSTPPIQPGTYVASRAKNPVALAASNADVVLCFGRSSWGPANTPTAIGNFNDAADTYGDGSQLATIAQQAFLGGAGTVVGYRFGDFTAATTATYSVTGSASTSLAINGASPGARVLSLELRIAPYDTNTYELRVFVDAPATLRQTITFPKTGGGNAQGEIGALKAAIDASNSPWIVSGAITGAPTGTTTVTPFSITAMTAGTDPTYAGTTLTDGLNACETASWKVLVSDCIDSTSNAAIAAYISRLRAQGYRRTAIVTEGVSTSSTPTLATRQTDAKALNNRAVGFVCNGFTDSTGTHHGFFAAARYAGMLAGTPTNRSTTHKLITGATDSYDGVPTADRLNKVNIQNCLAAGLICFTKNSAGQVQVEQGLSTLVTLDIDTDSGWQSLEITRSRDDFVDRLVQRWDQLIGQARNNPRGRSQFLSQAMSVLEDCDAAEMIQLYDTDGELTGTPGTQVSQVIDDPNHVSTGRYAYFLATIKSVGAVEIALIPITYSF